MALYLERKQQTDEEYSRRMDKLLEQAWREGRTPTNVVEASCWLRLEIFRMLRRGLRQLRLHEISGLQRLHALECCVVFGSPDAVKAVLFFAGERDSQRSRCQTLSTRKGESMLCSTEAGGLLCSLRHYRLLARLGGAGHFHALAVRRVLTVTTNPLAWCNSYDLPKPLYRWSE